MSAVSRAAVVLVAFVLILTQCTDNPSRSVKKEEAISPNLQQTFKAKSFTDVIPYSFRVDWDKGSKGYSEPLKANYYEYPLIWNDDFNPDALAGRHPNRLTYKLVAIPDSRGGATFYLLEFLEQRNSQTPALSWSDLDDNYTGRIYLINQQDRREVAQAYKKGAPRGDISEISKRQFRAYREGRQKISGENCIVVATEHYTDWYYVHEDGSLEYFATDYMGTTYETVCESSGGSELGGEYSGDDTSAGGDPGSGEADETREEHEDALLCRSETGKKIPCRELEKDPCETSAEEIGDVAYQASSEIKDKLSLLISIYGGKFGITNKYVLQHFLAQTAYESEGLSNLNEDLGSYTVQNLLTTFGKYFSQTDKTKEDPDDYVGNAEKIANLVYANRNGNGNIASGDGYKYRGRGIGQLTGKNKYSGFTSFYKSAFNSNWDFVSDPDLIASNSDLAVLSAMWYFKVNVLDKITVDGSTSVEDVTRIINGGQTGIKDRKIYYQRAVENITDCNK